MSFIVSPSPLSSEDGNGAFSGLSLEVSMSSFSLSSFRIPKSGLSVGLDTNWHRTTGTTVPVCGVAS